MTKPVDLLVVSFTSLVDKDLWTKGLLYKLFVPRFTERVSVDQVGVDSIPNSWSEDLTLGHGNGV